MQQHKVSELDLQLNLVVIPIHAATIAPTAGYVWQRDTKCIIVLMQYYA